MPPAQHLAPDACTGHSTQACAVDPKLPRAWGRACPGGAQPVPGEGREGEIQQVMVIPPASWTMGHSSTQKTPVKGNVMTLPLYIGVHGPVTPVIKLWTRMPGPFCRLWACGRPRWRHSCTAPGDPLLDDLGLLSPRSCWAHVHSRVGCILPCLPRREHALSAQGAPRS